MSLAILGIALIVQSHGQNATLVNDRDLKINSRKNVSEKRRELLQYIWGGAGFPKSLLPKVSTNVPVPVRGLSNLRRVDEFRIALTVDLEGLAYHFVPEQPKGELVVVHHGHDCTMDDPSGSADVGYGLQRTIAALLKEGYGVLGVFMPRMRPGDCGGSHNQLFETQTAGSALKFFLEPTAASLNYLNSQSRLGKFPRYRSFHMVGLSGGGWTTTIYSAIDPRIQCSFSVAGTIPLYLRSGSSVGDREQFEPSFYKLAGYPDFYVLAGYGRRRTHMQILLRQDDCCFGAAQHDVNQANGRSYAEALREYEARVRAVTEKLGHGSFRLEIDETAPSHMISHHTINHWILPTLRQATLPETRRPFWLNRGNSKFNCCFWNKYPRPN